MGEPRGHRRLFQGIRIRTVISRITEMNRKITVPSVLPVTGRKFPAEPPQESPCIAGTGLSVYAPFPGRSLSRNCREYSWR